MTAIDIGPFQNIVNVSWAKPRIVAIAVAVTADPNGEGSLPAATYDFNLVVNGVDLGEVLRHQIVVNRATATGPAPPIGQVISGAMLSYYAAWSSVPFREDGEIVHTQHGSHYYILPPITGVFPDFVPSPYGSVAAAIAYIDQQAEIHPEYRFQTFTIGLFPAQNSFAQHVEFRNVVFINLAAFAKDNNGKVHIEMNGSGPGTEQNIHFNLDAGLFRVPLAVLPVDGQGHPQFQESPDAIYSYHAQEADADTITGTILAHPENPPSLTGPDSPGGGPVG